MAWSAKKEKKDRQPWEFPQKTEKKRIQTQQINTLKEKL